MRIQALLNHQPLAQNHCRDVIDSVASPFHSRKRRHSLSDIFCPNGDLAQYALDKTRLTGTPTNHQSPSVLTQSSSVSNGLSSHSLSVPSSFGVPFLPPIQNFLSLSNDSSSNVALPLPSISTISTADHQVIAPNTSVRNRIRAANNKPNESVTPENHKNRTTRVAQFNPLAMGTTESIMTTNSVVSVAPALEVNENLPTATPLTQTGRSSAFTVPRKDSLCGVMTTHEPLSLLASLCSAQCNHY